VWAAAVLAGLPVAGCATSPTVLPETASMPARATAEEQARYQRALGETQSAASARQAEALGKIQGAR
jgi:hypothetical protein